MSFNKYLRTLFWFFFLRQKYLQKHGNEENAHWYNVKCYFYSKLYLKVHIKLLYSKMA